MPDSQEDAIIRDVLRAFSAARDPRLKGWRRTSSRPMEYDGVPPHTGKHE